MLHLYVHAKPLPSALNRCPATGTYPERARAFSTKDFARELRSRPKRGPGLRQVSPAGTPERVRTHSAKDFATDRGRNVAMAMSKCRHLTDREDPQHRERMNVVKAQTPQAGGFPARRRRRLYSGIVCW